MSELFSNSFKMDPLLSIFNSTGKKPNAFSQILFAVNTKAYFRRHLCFIATINDEIVAAALVKKKGVPAINFIDYARAGGWRLITCLGLKNFMAFLASYEKAKTSCNQVESSPWYLDTLAVADDWQGAGVGSHLLQQIFLYIKKNDGGLLTLITQNSNNCKFYNTNGFILFAKESLSNGETEITNYSFKRQIASIDELEND